MLLARSSHGELTVDRNYNTENQSEYYSITNERTGIHVHSTSSKGCEQIVECYFANKKRNYRKSAKFGRAIRNKALSLEGIKVYY